MKQSQLSVTKRWASPLLLGAVITGLVTAFLYRFASNQRRQLVISQGVTRHRFFPDIEEIRARERNKYNEKLQVILERREKQLLEMEQKKPPQ